MESPIARRRRQAERDFARALRALASLCADHQRGSGDERMLAHAIDKARENVEVQSRAVARVRLAFG